MRDPNQLTAINLSFQPMSVPLKMICVVKWSETKIARVEATFCVSVVVKRAEKKCTVVKNALKRIPTCNTWGDLFIDAIINVSEDDLSV